MACYNLAEEIKQEAASLGPSHMLCSTPDDTSHVVGTKCGTRYYAEAQESKKAGESACV